MWFIIQKTTLFLLLPPSGLLILTLAGFLVYKKIDKRIGVMIVAAGVALIYLLSLDIVSSLIIRPLENDYPPLTLPAEKPSAIVVLTSGVKDLSNLNLPPQPSEMTVSRLAYAMALFRQYPDLPLVICGGSGNPARPDLSEAKALARMAVEAGIPERSIIVEDRSFNTWEGAVQVSKILDGGHGKILLVTSAWHMARSVRFFTEAGFSVIPAPTDYKGGAIEISLYSLIPSAENLRTSSTACYEYLSRMRYGIF